MTLTGWLPVSRALKEAIIEGITSPRTHTTITETITKNTMGIIQKTGRPPNSGRGRGEGEQEAPTARTGDNPCQHKCCRGKS